jgi:acyl-ACP thioesterase
VEFVFAERVAWQHRRVPTTPGADEHHPMLPVPERGRRYTTSRLVRLGDVSPAGRLRLDATARYLQDIATDDAVDAGLESALAWVVRRSVIRVEQFARFREALTLTTFASGYGRSWAERRTQIRGDHGAVVDAAALWVSVDAASGRPASLNEGFVRVYGEAVGGRRIRARLSHPDPPPGLDRVSWPTRFTDFDALDHVNNAVYWAVVEEHLARRRDLRAPFVVEVEHRNAVERDHEVAVVAQADSDGGLWVWVVDGELVYASARVRPGVGDGPT